MSLLSHTKYLSIFNIFLLEKAQLRRDIYIKAIFSIEIILFKIICDKIIQAYIPSCVMLLPFKVSTTSWLIIL